MFPQLAAIAGGVILVVGLLAGTFFFGMRSKNPIVLGAVIWVSKVWLNKSQMRTAGTPGAYAGIVRHVGRVSGRAYETPVSPVPTDDGYAIALVYGNRTSWLRNVLASGQRDARDRRGDLGGGPARACPDGHGRALVHGRGSALLPADARGRCAPAAPGPGRAGLTRAEPGLDERRAQARDRSTRSSQSSTSAASRAGRSPETLWLAASRTAYVARGKRSSIVSASR